jgi:Velvet factor
LIQILSSRFTLRVAVTFRWISRRRCHSSNISLFPEKMETFTICQQPERGRMCGFTNMPDRRMLDPPLVLKLLKPSRSRKYHERIICIVTLMDIGNIHLSSIVKPPSSEPSSLLFGETFCQGRVLDDFEDSSMTSLYFIFSDLSIRVKGEFRLLVQLIDMNNLSRIFKPQVTNAFTIYPPKQFPGMKVSTDLTKYLFAQGIHIRRREYKYGGKGFCIDYSSNSGSSGSTILS